MFSFVFEEMSGDDVIKDGIAEELEPLIAIRDVVVMIRSVGEGLQVEEVKDEETVYRPCGLLRRILLFKQVSG